jgi:hypothetical protein
MLIVGAKTASWPTRRLGGRYPSSRTFTKNGLRCGVTDFRDHILKNDSPVCVRAGRTVQPVDQGHEAICERDAGCHRAVGQRSLQHLHRPPQPSRLLPPSALATGPTGQGRPRAARVEWSCIAHLLQPLTQGILGETAFPGSPRPDGVDQRQRCVQRSVAQGVPRNGTITVLG